MSSRLIVMRTQWPVGQGSFSSGKVDMFPGVPKSEYCFDYVYDCGAQSGELARHSIERYANTVEKVDALFVSHFDKDHINGVDYLCTRLPVNTVYLPYVDDETLAFELIANVAQNGTIDGETIESVLSPATWYGRRGVARVVRVSGILDEDSGGETPIPDIPGELGRDGERPPDRHAEISSSSIRRVVSGAESRAELLTLPPGSVILPHLQGATANWILVPYTHPVAGVDKVQLKQKVRTALGLAPQDEITPKAFANAVKSTSGLRALKACYREIGRSIYKGSSSNAVSMSLYSGPHTVPESDVRMLSGNHPGLPSWFINGAAGWIGTGDSELQDAQVLSAWLRFYSQFHDKIGTLLLPHHGSDANFDRGYLGIGELTVAISSSNPGFRGWGHPGPDTTAAIDEAKLIFARVTQDPGTCFRETITFG